jgi:hypothetical protein
MEANVGGGWLSPNEIPPLVRRNTREDVEEWLAGMCGKQAILASLKLGGCRPG